MRTRTIARLFIAYSAALTLSGACGQASPNATTEGGDTEATSGAATSAGSSGATEATSAGPTTDTDTGGAAPADYYPLVDGASWVYQHIKADMTTFDEVVNMEATTFEGAPAFKVSDQDDPSGEITVSILARAGTQTMRVHKEVFFGGAPIMIVDYDPGFLRYDNAWMMKGEVTDWMYDRYEEDGSGNPVDTTPRRQVFTVESLSTSVTVPAGTFDCVQILRERPATGKRKRLWFAEGVGKVRDEDLGTGSVEALKEYSIP
jgi:hypothetical protein